MLTELVARNFAGPDVMVWAGRLYIVACMVSMVLAER